MKLTQEQKERYLGMVLMGTAPETACDLLGCSVVDIIGERSNDSCFRVACFGAESIRHALRFRFEAAGADGFSESGGGE